MGKIFVLFWNQLSEDYLLSAGFNKERDLVFMCENNPPLYDVKHHKKKLVFLLSSMRYFEQNLRQKGYNIAYKKMCREDNSSTFLKNLKNLCSEKKPKEIVFFKPGEYKTYHHIKTLDLKANISIVPDINFLASDEFFHKWADKNKTLRMEYFYREMRKKHSILMSNQKPEGGAWNFDKENRKMPEKGMRIPKTYVKKPSDTTTEVIHLVEEKFTNHFGDIYPFHFAVTRQDALSALNLFIEERLPNFGDYQDAMIENEPWMFHSHISFYMNCALLNPMECIKAAEDAYYQGKAPLNAVEGFIRQILGWREYVRGIYWYKMPGYSKENFLQAEKKLPNFYWNADTKMNCIKQCVLETKKNAYAHHIQRLMVLGNFALLIGVDPSYLNEWFLIVYADAHEWVELPNVSGMVLYADGGLLASKPYAAGGSYINKMSNYCKNCTYNVEEKIGPDACPFNYLYWHFLGKNKEKLRSNQRLGMIYNVYEKMPQDKKEEIAFYGQKFIKDLS